MTATTPPLLLVDGHHLLYRAHFGFPKRFQALNCDLPCPQDTVTGMASPELTAPAALMKAAGLW
ncbi:hypothetical protein AB0N09_30670 [Streptomyces erythrochromogenes]|uniref:hypothetical protein n=1 Tax=Streptomyces erythrochromogenes TaxID=285574 RepID=UPI0034236E6B